MKQKPKHIVVFGANGGIGQAVVKKLADAVEDGEPYTISIVTRKGEGFARGLIDEILDGRSFDKAKHDNLAQAFETATHTYLNPKNLENLEPVLKDADVVISAGGLPRPNVPKGAAPTPRTALIYPNAKVVIPIAKAMARYAPAGTALIVGTNPLDNMVQVAQDALCEEWKKCGRAEKESLPAVKVIGMSSTLDGIRLKKFTARALNTALEKVGSPLRIEHARQEIEAHTYGQHGPEMVVDFEGIKVAPGGKSALPLDDFIAKHKLGDIKVPVNVKGEEKEVSIRDAIQINTTNAGAKQNVDIGRSAQTSTANRIADLAKFFCSDEIHKSTACVCSGFMGDETCIAYGRPIEIGKGKIALAKFPAHIKEGSDIAGKIATSRKAISGEQGVYTEGEKAEKAIMDTLSGRSNISLDSKTGVATFEIKSPSVNVGDIEAIKAPLAKLLDVDPKQIVNAATEGGQNINPRVLECKLEPRSMGAFNTLAEELGVSLQPKQMQI